MLTSGSNDSKSSPAAALAITSKAFSTAIVSFPQISKYKIFPLSEHHSFTSSIFTSLFDFWSIFVPIEIIQNYALLYSLYPTQ